MLRKRNLFSVLGKKIIIGFVSFATLFALSGCGGSDSGNSGNATATGQFKDANVKGVNYSCGDISGITDENGTFKYHPGEEVEFKIGKLSLGKVKGSKILTPADFDPDKNSSSKLVKNMLVLLQSLDSDGNPGNGIDINETIRNKINVSEINFSDDKNFTQVVQEINSSIGGGLTLVSPQKALQHFLSNLHCVYSGGYKGFSYENGKKSDVVGALIDKTGAITIISYNSENNYLNVFPGMIDINSSGSFAINESSDTITGKFIDPDHATGDWKNSSDGTSDTFSVERIGGDKNAKYRFTGHGTSSNNNNTFVIFTIDVDPNNHITGLAYDISGNEIYNITSGNLNGTHFEANLTGNVNVSGELNVTSGKLNGTWSWSNGTEEDNGILIGQGCQLN